MTKPRDDPEKPAAETGGEEETPLQREIKEAIHRIFELLGQEKPDVKVPPAGSAAGTAPAAGGLSPEMRRMVAESMARMPPVMIPLSALEQGPPRASSVREDPEKRQREFLASLRQSIAALERAHAGQDPEGAEEVRRILRMLGLAGGPGEPVN